ncbi:MAG: hypothetical protein U1F83_14180 [Verrucomicrobiota bacterium]
MKVRKGRVLGLVFMIALIAVGFLGWREHKVAVAYHQLAITISGVTNITVYDLSASTDMPTPTNLSSSTSSPFPVELFSRSAGKAEYRNPLLPVWKGSSLAVLSLRDGTTRRARFSYYGGFFALEGVPGYYVVGQDSDFHSTFKRIVSEVFVLERMRNRKAPNETNAK